MQLNDLQRAVVENWKKPVLVMAPVGTGKTMALAERAAAAIAGGMNPERMLCLSFTNRAAREVQTRVGNAVQCSTFHALCALVLRAEADALGLPTRLRDVGVLPAHFAELARKAMDNPWVRTNPSRIDDPRQVEDILQRAW